MDFIKYRSRGSSVAFLQELLEKCGYELTASGYFGLETEEAVKDFQAKNQLVIDGKVGVKTWTVLLSKTRPAEAFGDKFLEENDLINFAVKHELQLAAVKAVNEVESSGKGFLIDGRPKILFEGHVFWRELKKRGIDPKTISNFSNADVLYPSWTKQHYLGGIREYERLEKAKGLGDSKKYKEAALASCSWGSYQIMGFHAEALGYASVQQFADEMAGHERNNLEAFGKYLQTYGCMKHLRNLDWTKFAECYNGPAQALNHYDSKMKKAYERFNTNS